MRPRYTTPPLVEYNEKIYEKGNVKLVLVDSHGRINLYRLGTLVCYGHDEKQMRDVAESLVAADGQWKEIFEDRWARWKKTHVCRPSHPGEATKTAFGDRTGD